MPSDMTNKMKKAKQSRQYLAISWYWSTKKDKIKTIIALINELHIETCNFLRSHAIRHDQQNKERGTRHIHNTYRSTSTGLPRKIKSRLL
jgi:hypothetical protein